MHAKVDVHVLKRMTSQEADGQDLQGEMGGLY